MLLAYRDGHAHHPAKASPIPAWRCHDCRMVLPNAVPGIGPRNPGGRWGACPVCGSGRMVFMDLCRAWGTFPDNYDAKRDGGGGDPGPRRTRS